MQVALSSRRQFVRGTVGAAILALGSGMAIHPRGSAQSTDSLEINASGVRLRAAPTLSAAVLATLAYGTALRYLADGGWANGYHWVRVRVEATGRTGYVAAMYVDTPGSGDYPLGATFHVDTADGGRANLRSSASLAGSVVRTVPNGTNGTIASGRTTASGYTWYKVTVAGATGYMATIVMAPGALYTGRPRVKVADGPLNVRYWAGLDGPVIRTVPTGAVGTITEVMPVTRNGMIWVHVQFDSPVSVTGWVAQSFLAWV